MREHGTAAESEDTSSSSFVIIGGGGGGGGDDEEDDRANRQKFARNLDSKLKKLQHRREPGGGKHASRKPVFVTTVKTGIFLDPPPDLAALLGLDRDGDGGGSPEAGRCGRYYSYSSEPRVLYDKHHQRVRKPSDRRPPADDVCKQTGYTNIMHDKRVVRGSNYTKKTFFCKESLADREAEAHRRIMARKRAMDYQTRALRSHMGAPKLTKSHQNVDIQTDIHIEKFYNYPPSQTFGAQTEFEQEYYSNPGTGTSTGTDASTQVEDKELFDFDNEVTPTAETLIADVFRQAMREVLYEDELDARARQQRALYLKRTIEEIEKQRLECQDERLNKVIDDNAQSSFNEGENDEKARISKSTPGRVTDLLPEVLDDLNRNGFITNATAKTVESPDFLHWLTEELLQLNETKYAESDEILKSRIYDLAKLRLDSVDKITEVQNIQKPKELFEEIETVTLQSDQIVETDSRTNDS